MKIKRQPRVCRRQTRGCYSIVGIVVKGVFVQRVEVKELGQGHVERQRDLVKRFHTRVLRQSAHDVVQRGLPDVAHGREFVDRDAARSAKRPYALDIQIGILHTTASLS